MEEVFFFDGKPLDFLDKWSECGRSSFWCLKPAHLLTKQWRTVILEEADWSWERKASRSHDSEGGWTSSNHPFFNGLNKKIIHPQKDDGMIQLIIQKK